MKTVPILKTPRCIMNGIEKRDMPFLYQIFNDPLTKKYLPEIYELINEEEKIQHMVASFDSYLKVDEGVLWAVRIANCLIGFVAVMDISDNPTIIYAMHPNSRRHGYMKESVSCVIDYLFNHQICHCLQTEVYEENTASINILLNNKFHIVKKDRNKIFLKRCF